MARWPLALRSLPRKKPLSIKEMPVSDDFPTPEFPAMLELHCHTTYSDGTLTPAELVAAAAIAQVKAIAITDHDTLSGWPEAFAAAEEYGIEIVPGVELSTVYRGRSLHILGFYPDPEALTPDLIERREGRKRRAQEMADRLANLGYPISLPPLAGAIAPGRLHIAQALVAAGHIAHPQEAFERFIGEDKPAYVHYEKFPAVEGIALLRSTGAVPVWAHPCLFRGGTVASVLPELVAAGLLGLEVYHPAQSPSDTRHLLAYCQQYSLLPTGGSDYHGPSETHTKATQPSALNQFALPLSLLTPIQQAAGGLTPR
ncbi:MAG: PHP domain-containing protein [Synechococcales bacterium]|nr:PHP domain-containing protein [Synechococcales bacterium]